MRAFLSFLRTNLCHGCARSRASLAGRRRGARLHDVSGSSPWGGLGRVGRSWRRARSTQIRPRIEFVAFPARERRESRTCASVVFLNSEGGYVVASMELGGKIFRLHRRSRPWWRGLAPSNRGRVDSFLGQLPLGLRLRLHGRPSSALRRKAKFAWLSTACSPTRSRAAGSNRTRCAATTSLGRSGGLQRPYGRVARPDPDGGAYLLVADPLGDCPRRCAAGGIWRGGFFRGLLVLSTGHGEESPRCWGLVFRRTAINRQERHARLDLAGRLA